MCKRQVMAGVTRAVQKPGVHWSSGHRPHRTPRRRHRRWRAARTGSARLATGFDARAYVRPMEIVGENGLTFDEAWADGPHAYRSVAVPGFPNLFMLMGPHSPIGNQSLVMVAENQADYAMWWINQIRQGRVIAVAPTETATKDYNEQMKSAMPPTIRMTGWNVGTWARTAYRSCSRGRHRGTASCCAPGAATSTCAPRDECDRRHSAGGADPCRTRRSFLTCSRRTFLTTARVCSNQIWKERRCSHSSAFGALATCPHRGHRSALSADLEGPLG